MLKTRDFYLMKVYNIQGKYLGVIDDIAIDFYNSSILGFTVSSFSLFNKKNFIDIDKIISLTEIVIVSELTTKKGLFFNDIKYMDIIDGKNMMKGVLEDFVIDRKDFTIKGLVISSGIVDRMYKGKEIILTSSCILCESFILYTGNELVRLKTLPHNLGGK